MSKRRQNPSQLDKQFPSNSKHSWRRALFGLLTLISFLGLWSLQSRRNAKQAWPATQHQRIANQHVSAWASEQGRYTMLLIGTDQRPQDKIGNADVIIVASIDQAHKRIAFMSIPRDTQVTFPNGKYAKINESLHAGGPELTMALTENLLGMPINHYGLTYFSGLVQLINTIQGIRIHIPKPMYYQTGDKQYGIIQLHPGTQTLNGEQALAFVRYRNDTLGDIGRTNRQQTFLAALAHKLLDPHNIQYIPAISRDWSKTVETDLSLADSINLAGHINELKTFSTIHETLPGSFHNPSRSDPSDLSYWVINPAQARYTAKQFFTDGILQTNPIQDPQVTKYWSPPTTEKQVTKPPEKFAEIHIHEADSG